MISLSLLLRQNGNLRYWVRSETKQPTAGFFVPRVFLRSSVSPLVAKGRFELPRQLMARRSERRVSTSFTTWPFRCRGVLRSQACGNNAVFFRTRACHLMPSYKWVVKELNLSSSTSLIF